MDKRSLLMFALMMMAMYMFMNFVINPNRQKQVVVKPVTFTDVQALEKQAGNDRDKLNKVIKACNEVANNDPESEEAAKARLEKAKIEETKLDQEAVAVSDYQSLVRDFPKTSPAAREAQDRMVSLERRIDARNSKEFGYKAFDALVSLTGRNPKYSCAIALLIITLIVKIVTTPLSRKQYQSMKEMQKISPLVKELQEKYKGDQKALGEKTMALYKEHGVNPFASCLPLLVQMPVLIGLYYKVILAYQYQFAKGQFLWIGSSLVNKVPAFFTVNLLGHTFRPPLLAANLAMPDLFLLLLYTGSMVISQKLTVVDPSQAEQQKMMAWMMPLMFMFLFAKFPSALMLYWLMFNIFSTAQQYFIMSPQFVAEVPSAGVASESSSSEKDKVPSKVPRKK